MPRTFSSEAFFISFFILFLTLCKAKPFPFICREIRNYFKKIRSPNFAGGKIQVRRSLFHCNDRNIFVQHRLLPKYTIAEFCRRRNSSAKKFISL